MTDHTDAEAAQPPEDAVPMDGATPPGDALPTDGATPPSEDAPDEDAPDEDAPDDEPAAAGEPERPAEPLPGRSRRRISAANVVIGLLLGVLGFGLVVQVRSNTSDAQLATSRPEDLVRILSDLDARQERLRQEIADLEDSQRQLDSGAQGREAALAEARRRADDLGILAGTLPAEGPGLEIKLIPGGEPIRAATVLDAVEELRGAGAEAMQIGGGNGAAVRIVASTYFVDSGDRLLVDGVTLDTPYTLLVIGDPQTMQTALNIPGGVVDSLRQHGGSVSVRDSDTISVSALRRGGGLKYARPA